MDPFLKRMADGEEIFNLLLISCSKEEDAVYWENRLERTLAITEKWEGGAGNALGTLHAIEQAEKKAKERGLASPLQILANGGSVALYHTAGKGSRMAPLTQAEGGMKAAIKLPAFLPDGRGPLSILEMVVRQTAPLSSLSKGRLSVFWTDQLFLPSSLSWEPPTHDVEVYAIELPHVTLADFQEKKLSSYGLWQGDQHLEKLTLSQFQALTQGGPFSGAVNLGSFSMSYLFLKRLLETYQSELKERKGKLDTDPDWWTVATLPKELYITLKGEGKEAHYKRFKALAPTVAPRILGPDTDWWDFGTVESYRKQLQKLLQQTPEAARLRALFGIPSLLGENSLTFCSNLENCSVNGSLLLNVKAKDCHFDHTVAFDTELEGTVLSHALVYGTRQK